MVDDPAVEVRARRRHLLAVAVLVLAHALVAVSFPLSGDEAYYWDCSRHAEWSTFDQPKLTIWTIGVARVLFGDSHLAVRTPALLAGLVIGLLLPPLVRRLGGSTRDATRAWLWLHVLPLFALGLSYASTDVVMSSAWVGAVLASVAIVQGRRAAWWGLGIALGLGFLAKFPIVTAFLPAAATLLSPSARRDLRTPVPWAAALLSAALTAPVWIWGWRNDWDNLLFQLSWRHSAEGRWRLDYLLEFVGATVGLASPVLAVLLLVAFWRMARARSVSWQVMTAAAIAPFLLFGLVALRTRVGGHWGAPGLIVLVVGFVLFGVGRPWARRLAAVVGVALTAALLVVLSFPAAVAAGAAALDPEGEGLADSDLVRLRGSEALAAALEERRDAWANELGVAPGSIYVSSESYSAVHLMAFYSDGKLDTRLLRVTGGDHGLASLYWYSPEQFEGRRFLVFTEKDDWRLPLLEKEIHRFFGVVGEEPPIVLDLGALGTRTLRLWRAEQPLEPARMFTRAAVRAEQAF